MVMELERRAVHSGTFVGGQERAFCFEVLGGRRGRATPRDLSWPVLVVGNGPMLSRAVLAGGTGSAGSLVRARRGRCDGSVCLPRARQGRPGGSGLTVGIARRPRGLLQPNARRTLQGFQITACVCAGSTGGRLVLGAGREALGGVGWCWVGSGVLGPLRLLGGGVFFGVGNSTAHRLTRRAPPVPVGVRSPTGGRRNFGVGWALVGRWVGAGRWVLVTRQRRGTWARDFRGALSRC